MGTRFALLIVPITLAYIYLGSHLYTLQIKQGDRFLALAESQNIGPNSFDAARGAIYFMDKDGKRTLAALNKDFSLLYANPKKIEDPLEASHALGFAIGIDADALLKKFSSPKNDYVSLVKKAPPSLVQKVLDLNINGVVEKLISSRFYPLGDSAAQVLGFVAPNADNNGESGKYGVERFYNDKLSGVDGDLVLTIDPNIQKEAERILHDLVSRFSAKGGTVIVQEPKTGKILAFGNDPTFDPNEYGSFPVGSFLNSGLERIYEPGSVFKVLTMAAGLDAGKITPDTTFNDTGVLNVSGKKIQNWDLKAHGLVTMTNVIEQSLNTGAAFAERKIGNELFTGYLKKFGLGEKTGIDLPGELKGNIGRLTAKAPPAIAFATASFGQGVSVTPLQLINAISVLANGGSLMKPFINADNNSKEIHRVISEDAAKAVTKMMVSAVDKAKVAKISGYSIAGKTGTAQVPDFVHGGYLDKNKAVIDTYVGFGPASDAKFIILIRVDEPAGAVLAGETVVPAFRDLAQFILNYYNIPPDRIENSND